ncbi:MAG TPA: lipoate--protein ligase family protein [Planctomycetes bacterium]|nr:lipoate--protein ligase family protein [Planctomycetota bacterium]
METWRLLRTFDGPAGWNMGLDEALLLLPAERPTLRLYTWDPPALSLGYFQRAADVPALARVPRAVRRLTGGGAIHHAEELTFSIALPADHPLYAGPVRESYLRIHATIARALEGLGVPASPRGDRPLASDRPSGGMCFEDSCELDLVWGDRKGVGSAQRRTGGRILHHGSIKLSPSEFDTQVASIRSRAPGTTPEQLADLLRLAFEKEHGIEFTEESPGPEELSHAEERAPHFTSDAFLRRR